MFVHPEEYRGTFRCNDEELNRIWEVGAYTMHLTTREFFIDGIKRDRWVWSGDAIQSYLMNYYLFFDSESVKRTIWLLRGKDPVTSHSNTIMDYTFYWFLSVYDYYLYSGDRQFVNQLYPRMQTMMDYVLGRTNKNGMVEGMSGDWVFVDWADGYLDKKGELSFEQVLFCRSLETMALCAGLVGDRTNQQKYEKLAATLKAKLETTFWNASKQALVHNSINGVQSDAVTRYANMFSVFFNYLTPEKQQAIKHSVLLNDSILKITTPYMRFYELEALCALGEQETVMQEMKAYWGGMLKEGATSFWEKYNPEESGTQHLSMYGRPYGKSLCHAWGASPIYLLGKYYLGVKPVKEGYKEFSITPVLGGLKWMEGSVPTPNGNIHIHMDRKMIKVRATEGKGYLTIKSIQGKRHLMFETGSTQLICRRLEGEFLDYRNAIPRNNPISILVDTKAMLNSLDRVSVVISEKLKSPVHCIFDAGRVYLSAKTGNGEAKDICPVEGDGQGLEIGFNNRFFMDALRYAPAEKVKMELNTGISPCIMTPVEGEENFLYMVLPVRLKA